MAPDPKSLEELRSLQKLLKTKNELLKISQENDAVLDEYLRRKAEVSPVIASLQASK